MIFLCVVFSEIVQNGWRMVTTVPCRFFSCRLSDVDKKCRRWKSIDRYILSRLALRNVYHRRKRNQEKLFRCQSEDNLHTFGRRSIWHDVINRLTLSELFRHRQGDGGVVDHHGDRSRVHERPLLQSRGNLGRDGEECSTDGDNDCSGEHSVSEPS